jgi:hypothetical protein
MSTQEPAPTSSNPSPRAGGRECWVRFEEERLPAVMEREPTEKEKKAFGGEWFHMVEPLPVEKGPHECAWTETARDFRNGMELYRNLLDECAKHLGPAAYISDDGSVQDEPIRLNIPGLVAKLAAPPPALPWEALDKLRDLGEDICVEHCEPLDSGSEKHCSWCKQIADIRNTLKGETRHGI